MVKDLKYYRFRRILSIIIIIGAIANILFGIAIAVMNVDVSMTIPWIPIIAVIWASLDLVGNYRKVKQIKMVKML